MAGETSGEGERGRGRGTEMGTDLGRLAIVLPPRKAAGKTRGEVRSGVRGVRSEVERGAAAGQRAGGGGGGGGGGAAAAPPPPQPAAQGGIGGSKGREMLEGSAPFAAQADRNRDLGSAASAIAFSPPPALSLLSSPLSPSEPIAPSHAGVGVERGSGAEGLGTISLKVPVGKGKGKSGMAKTSMSRMDTPPSSRRSNLNSVAAATDSSQGWVGAGAWGNGLGPRTSEGTGVSGGKGSEIAHRGKDAHMKEAVEVEEDLRGRVCRRLKVLISLSGQCALVRHIYTCTYIHIYTYIWRERQRERERERDVCMYIYILFVCVLEVSRATVT